MHFDVDVIFLFKYSIWIIFTSLSWMKKLMIQVCIYTLDEGENAPGTNLYLWWRCECSGYVSIALDEKVNVPGMYLYLGWRRECSGYVSKPWMTKWMFRVCIYTWDEKENAPGMYLYLRWKSECSGYVSIPGMKKWMLRVCI